MRAIDNPLGKNATGGGNNLGRVKHTQGCAVPERIRRVTAKDVRPTDESCAILHAKS